MVHIILLAFFFCFFIQQHTWFGAYRCGCICTYYARIGGGGGININYAMIRGGGGYVRIGVVNADNARMECFMHVHKSCSRLGFGCGASKRGLDPHLHWLILYNSAETNIDNEFEILELCLSPLWVAAKTLCYYWCCIVSSLRSEVKYIVGCGLVVWVC